MSALELQSAVPSPHDTTDEDHPDHERLLPIANISRIMKIALPANAKMSKEAKACVQECVSEYISFITSEASDRLKEDKRKTITGDDIVDSMKALGFDAYMAFLQRFLARYRRTKNSAKATGSVNVQMNQNQNLVSSASSLASMGAAAAHAIALKQKRQRDEEDEEQARKRHSQGQ